jgi:hypothetical protein
VESGFDSRQGKEFSLLHSVQIGCVAASYPMDIGDDFSGFKRSERDVGQPSPPSAEVKNGGAISAFPIQSVIREIPPETPTII